MGSRSRCRRLSVRLAAALALAALPALAATLAVHRVSDLGIAEGDVGATPPAVAPRFSANGEWVVWTQDAEVDNGWNLYAARRWDGSPALLLSAAYPAGQGIVAFEVTPDSQRAVYLAGTFPTGPFQLWSAPLDGSAAPERLNPVPPPGGGVTDFELSPDGARAVFLGDLPVAGEIALWSVPVAGPSGQADRLSPLPVFPGQDVEAFTVAPNSQRVALAGVLRNQGINEVWSAPLAGPAPATPVSPNGTDTAIGVVIAPDLPLAFSQDGARVLFAGDFQNPGVLELWSNTNTGAPAQADRLNPLPVAGGEIAGFAPAPGANRVVFRGDLLVDGQFELWSAPVDGSSAATRISHATPVAAGDVTGFAVGPGGAPRVLFRADAFVDERFDLYQVPITGGGPTRLNAASVAAGDVDPDFALAPDGARVVFRGNLTSAAKVELYSAASNGGSGSALRLSPDTTPAGANVDAFVIDSTSSRVAFAGDLTTDGRTDLWSVPIAGPASSGVRLQPAPDANENVTAFALAPGGASVAFVADLVTDETFDLWVAPLAGPAPAAPVAMTAVAGGDATLPLAWSGDGSGVLFLGDLESNDRFLLWDADALIFRADFEEGDTSEWSSAVP